MIGNLISIKEYKITVSWMNLANQNNERDVIYYCVHIVLPTHPPPLKFYSFLIYGDNMFEQKLIYQFTIATSIM